MFFIKCEKPSIIQTFPTSNYIDTSNVYPIRGYAYGSEFCMFFKDLNSDYTDTFYKGKSWYVDNIYIPKFEWGELWLISTTNDSIYMRLKCTQLWAKHAGCMKLSYGIFP
jgi:hypothetical protein